GAWAIESPYIRALLWSYAISVTAAFLLLAYYFITSDFSLYYVWRFSSTELPWVYRLTAVWTDVPGALLLFVWVAALAALHLHERGGSDGKKISVIVMSVGMLFVPLVLQDSPFKNFNEVHPGEDIPGDGMGLPPLLVNIWAVFHPPGIFAGYAFLTVAFASSLAHMLRGTPGWDRFSSGYSRLAWLVLGGGIAAGCVWSYEAWNWYWTWDPAFNSSVMVWLLLTAYLHASSRYRINEYPVVTPALGAFSFVLALYSMYVIHGGGFNSTHSFGEGSSRGLLDISLLAGTLSLISIAILARRTWAGAGRSRLFSLSIALMSALAFLLLWGLAAPGFVSALSISPALYIDWGLPVTIILISVMGLCLARNRRIAAVLFAAVMVLFIIEAPAGGTYSNVIAGLLAASAIVAALGLVRDATAGGRGIAGRIAPDIIHLGTVILLAGVMMSTYAVSETVLFRSFGDTKEVGGYEIQLADLAYPLQHGHTGAAFSKIGIYNIYKNGERIGTGEASFTAYSSVGAREEYVTRPLIYRSLLYDVYITYQGIGTTEQVFISVANVKVIPGMSFIWIGSGLLLIGMLILVLRNAVSFSSLS
ncbi:MAG TPA: cytochrome c biogenesis protein CcsA, partial [Candidatus Methanoperedenaceae archaeon]|nr:cytochrome c biogenesis protein CcsA [Candidatus Methanoperedenaceae archaeon]